MDFVFNSTNWFDKETLSPKRLRDRAEQLRILFHSQTLYIYMHRNLLSDGAQFKQGQGESGMYIEYWQRVILVFFAQLSMSFKVRRVCLDVSVL